MSYAYKIPPNSKVKLKEYDPDATAGLDKDEGKERFAELNAELDKLQEELYAAGRHAVLVILQGMDTSGKDGAIRHVLQNINPQGCRVESFKAPTEEELSRDFLWRVHKVTPRKGMFGVFNRSHYEDVLVVRVHDFVPKDVWQARYAQINQFEAMLTAQHTIILKFFLHISKEEQKRRLLERERDTSKAWKLAKSDWQEREYWNDYTTAYEDVLSRCSTKTAPWYIVPADKKWFRNLAVSEALVKTLRQYRPSWEDALAKMSKARLAELETMRKKPRGD